MLLVSVKLRAAFALAVPSAVLVDAERVALPSPIDRRALADRPDLQLTEARVRGAIRTLEAVGFARRPHSAGLLLGWKVRIERGRAPR